MVPEAVGLLPGCFSPIRPAPRAPGNRLGGPSLPFGSKPGRIQTQTVARARLLNLPEADILTLQTVLGGADVAAADHRLATAELTPRNEPQGATTRA